MPFTFSESKDDVARLVKHDLTNQNAFRALLDQQRPATVLKTLSDDAPLELAAYKAKALLALDRTKEAGEYLDPRVPQLQGDDYARAERLWAEILLRQGWLDGAILSAEGAARATQTPELRAAALATSAVGYARKHCWNSAENALREARQIAPEDSVVLAAEARVRLEMDQRLDARAVYEQMTQLEAPWAKPTGEWGRAHVAFLLGEFDSARTLAKAALHHSEEMIGPLFVLAQTALASDDLPAFQGVLKEMERRSPQAEVLAAWKEELGRLQNLHTRDPNVKRKRLTAFPTTVQRRDYCGPCSIELVLRYWQGDGGPFGNDDIAQAVKFPGGGTPLYKMREFFHLVGFDTVRCLAPVDKLKQLVDEGYPVIVQEEYADTSHVAVVIGYDDGAGALEFQDPMTHRITPMLVDEVNRVRATYLNSAVVAFPRGQGRDDALARALDLFDEPAVVWTDQAGLALDEGRAEAAADLMARATAKLPGQRLSWITWLHAESDRWASARRTLPVDPTPLAAKLVKKTGQDAQAARERFYTVLARAKSHHPDAEFVYQFEGQGALMEGDLPRAIAAFQKAAEIDPADARNFASLAEAYYAIRNFEKTEEAAWNALHRYPALPAANVWLARCLNAQRKGNALHYARAAVELAPDWWLARLALGECYAEMDDLRAARRELDAAFSLAPNHPEVRVRRAILAFYEGDKANAAMELENALAAPQPLNLITTYDARQVLCRILFSSGLFTEAVEQIKTLLPLTPEDPWALQFLAAARSQQLVQTLAARSSPASFAKRPEQRAPRSAAERGSERTRAGNREDAVAERHAVEEVKKLYERGVDANQGRTWVVRDYLDALVSLGALETALAEAARLRDKYANNGNLIFTHAQYLARAGQAEPAARATLAALVRADGVQNFDELYEAVKTILAGLGLAGGEQAVLESPVPEGGAPLGERLRALGLLLALYPEERAARARELLTAVLEANPEDAFATLRLGDVAQADSDREALYRRALLLAPRWPLARAHLADYLIDNHRAAEALEFTDGHETESAAVMAEHGRALLSLGRYEEAAPVLAQAVEWSGRSDSWMLYYKWAAEEWSGQHEAALATAREGRALFPGVLAWHVDLATSLRSLGKFEEARQVMVEGQAQGLSQADVLAAEYETAWAHNDLGAALTAVEALASLTGETAGDAQLGRWESKRLRLLLEAGRVAEARQFIHAEGLDARGWGEAAWAAMLAEEWELCLECAEKTLALDAQNFSGLFCKAEALCGLDREAEAVKVYRQLRQAQPNEHNAYEKLALLAATAGKGDEALELAERAVALGPYCPFAWAARGYAHFVRGEHAEAADDLQTAWNRADAERRRSAHEFWWMLAELLGEKERAAERKHKAIQSAKSASSQRQIRQIEALLVKIPHPLSSPST